MMNALLLFVSSFAVVITAEPRGPFLSFFPETPHRSPVQNAGDPLFLTPLIKGRDIANAQRMSEVRGLNTSVKSYSGFLTVNSTHNSNMFFWYFPAKDNADRAPLVLWLQGGPGGSSLFGLFVENGPFSVDSDIKLVPREYSWHRNHNMLYIDNPVGTGFSFTDSDLGYARNEDDVARDLYEALHQFFTMFPHHQKNDFFIAGESYAGKYVPAISYKIHQENQNQQMKIPLKGLAIGDGLCDPIHQLNYGEFLYSIGMITNGTRERFFSLQKQTAAYIRKGNLKKAFWLFSKFMDFYVDATGLNFVYNYLLQDTPADFGYYPHFLVKDSTRAAIHVGNLPFSETSGLVYNHLTVDIMRTVRGKIAGLLDAGYIVLIYNGQMDVIIDYIGTQKMVELLPWSGRQRFAKAKRMVWRVEDYVAGYVREALPLVQVMVRNAGHILPYDQPRAAYELMKRFTHRQTIA